MNKKNKDSIVAVALSGAFKDKVVKEAKAHFLSGEQVRGEMTVRIPFRITKGFESEIKPTATVLSQTVLAKALVYSGITAEAFKTALLKAAKESLGKGCTLGQEVAQDPRVAVMISEMDDVINQMPKIKRAGSVSVAVLTETGLPEVTSFVMEVPVMVPATTADKQAA